MKPSFFASTGRTADAKRLNKNPLEDFYGGLGGARLGFDTASGLATNKQNPGRVTDSLLDYALPLYF